MVSLPFNLQAMEEMTRNAGENASLGPDQEINGGPVTRKRFILSTLIGWALFLGIDFFFHASLLEEVWRAESEAIKPQLDLFVLIPAGYASFFLLTALLGYVYHRVYPEKPERRDALKFGLIVSSLYAIGNFLALYSYVNLPLVNLAVNHAVLFVECFSVVVVYYYTLHAEGLKRQAWVSLLICISLFMAGILLQNI